MNNPLRLVLSILVLSGLTLARAQTAAPASKPGYTVLVEVSYDEQGAPVSANVVQSDDPTGDHILEQIAMNMSGQDKQPPKVVDGKPVKFKARRPFNFPVEGDQGEAANANRPVLRSGAQVLPKFPPTATAPDEGGAILELVIRADGSVRSTKVLTSSNPEFAQAAESAVRQWVFKPRDGPGMPMESTWHVAIGFSKEGHNVDLKWRLAPRPSLGGFIAARAPAKPAAPAAPATPAAPEVPAEKK